MNRTNSGIVLSLLFYYCSNFGSRQQLTPASTPAPSADTSADIMAVSMVQHLMEDNMKTLVNFVCSSSDTMATLMERHLKEDDMHALVKFVLFFWIPLTSLLGHFYALSKLSRRARRLKMSGAKVKGDAAKHPAAAPEHLKHEPANNDPDMHKPAEYDPPINHEAADGGAPEVDHKTNEDGNYENYLKFSLDELTVLCRARLLPLNGTNVELAKRLADYSGASSQQQKFIRKATDLQMAYIAGIERKKKITAKPEIFLSTAAASIFITEHTGKPLGHDA